jgi:hypothetical protein
MPSMVGETKLMKLVSVAMIAIVSPCAEGTLS